MTLLFKPKKIINLNLDLNDDEGKPPNVITWSINPSNPSTLSKDARIFLNEVKAKNTSSKPIKLYGQSFLDDNDAYDSFYKSSFGALLFTLPITGSSTTTTVIPYQYPETDLIANWKFNNNFIDTVNGYNFSIVPLNQDFILVTEKITQTTTRFLRIGDELTLPSINELPNTFNILSAGEYTIDFSGLGKIDLKDSNGVSALPSGFVKNGYPILKDTNGDVINPIAWYKFDDGSDPSKIGTDSMGNYDLENVGAVDLNKASIKGEFALSLNDPNNEYLQTVDDFMDVDANTEMSVCFWAKRNTTNVENHIFSHGVITIPNQWGARYNSGTNATFRFTIFGNALFSTTTFGTEWNHFVCVLDPTGATKYMNLYANGVYDTQRTYTALSVSNNKLFIGKQNEANNGFNGRIDDFRIYNQVLTAEQISELYTGSVTKYFKEMTVFTETFEYDNARTDKGLYTWSVPDGVDEVTAYIWGAGGGGCGEAGIRTPYNGGAGGFIKATLDVTNLSSIKIVVGEGGKGRENETAAGITNNGGWGGGGDGRSGNDAWSLGSGGGLSALFETTSFDIASGLVNAASIPIIVAGAGGGGGGADAATVNGGGGGNGTAFTDGKTGGNDPADNNGRGGTGSAGGDGGTGGQNGSAGVKYSGGNGALYGAGGGAGYFGGGGGGSGSGAVGSGGGGGGSSYWGHSAVTYIADVGGDNGSTTAPDTTAFISGFTVPESIAKGGATTNTFGNTYNGGNGYIVLQYTRQIFYNDFSFKNVSPYGYVLSSFDDEPDKKRNTSVEVPYYIVSQGQSGLTISFDLRITGYNSAGIDMILSDEDGYLAIKGTDTGNLWFKLNNSSSYSVVVGGYPNDSLWHNYAFVNDRLINRIYIDGVEQNVVDPEEVVNENLVDGLLLGEFVGELSNLRMYNVALEPLNTVLTSTVSGGDRIVWQNSNHTHQKNFKVNERLLSGGQKLSIKLVDGVKSDLDELQVNFVVYDNEEEKQEDTGPWQPKQVTDRKISYNR